MYVTVFILLLFPNQHQRLILSGFGAKPTVPGLALSLASDLRQLYKQTTNPALDSSSRLQLSDPAFQSHIGIENSAKP